MSEGEVSGKDSQDFYQLFKHVALYINKKNIKRKHLRKKQVIADISNYWLNNLLEWIVVTYWPYLDKLSPQPNFKVYDQFSCHEVYTYEIIFWIYFQVQIVVSAPGNGDNFKSRTMKQSGNVYVYNTRS